jgi:hypothetical protein
LAQHDALVFGLQADQIHFTLAVDGERLQTIWNRVTRSQVRPAVQEPVPGRGECRPLAPR